MAQLPCHWLQTRVKVKVASRCGRVVKLIYRTTLFGLDSKKRGEKERKNYLQRLFPRRCLTCHIWQSFEVPVRPVASIVRIVGIAAMSFGVDIREQSSGRLSLPVGSATKLDSNFAALYVDDWPL
jgi:hypothetical protein